MRAGVRAGGRAGWRAGGQAGRRTDGRKNIRKKEHDNNQFKLQTSLAATVDTCTLYLHI